MINSFSSKLDFPKISIMSQFLIFLSEKRVCVFLPTSDARNQTLFSKIHLFSLYISIQSSSIVLHNDLAIYSYLNVYFLLIEWFL